MWADIVLIAILLAVVIGFWLTRNSKGAKRLPGMAARDVLLDARTRRAEHDEAFQDAPDGQSSREG